MAGFEIDLDRVNVKAPETDTAPLPVNNATSNSGAGQVNGHQTPHPLLAETDVDEEVWGVENIDAPIFMMTSKTVAQVYQTSINIQTPKSSVGLTQAEANVRLVRILLLLVVL